MFGIDDMALATGLGGVANLAGGLFGGITSANGAASAQAQQNQQFQQQMQVQQQQYNQTRDDNMFYFTNNWANQEYMSNTAYQRATADMKAAGLNPILAYQQGGAGGGSGSQSGAGGAGMPSAPTPINTQADIGRGIERGISSATNAVSTMQQLELNAERVKTEKKNQDFLTAGTAEKGASTGRIIAETGLTGERTKTQDNERAALDAQAQAARAAASASSASAAATSEDARRKRDYGDSTLGQNANSATRMIGNMWNTIKGAMSHPIDDNFSARGINDKLNKPFAPGEGYQLEAR